MFHYLREKPRILVTGIMRSGTTICADMIAHDTGKSVVREEWLLSEDPYKLPVGTILQAPVLLEAALEFKARNWHVVVVLRKFEDCLASAEKLVKSVDPNVPDGLEKVLRAKQKFLDMWLDSDMAPMAVRYEDLKAHPLWVEDRKGWGFRQTKSGPNYTTEMGLA